MCGKTLYFERSHPIPRISDGKMELVTLTGCGCCERQTPIPMPGSFAYCKERDIVINLDHLESNHAVCVNIKG